MKDIQRWPKTLIARTDIARLPSSKSTLPIYESGQLGNVDACPEEVREIQQDAGLWVRRREEF
jgi:hypothetical protein